MKYTFYSMLLGLFACFAFCTSSIQPKEEQPKETEVESTKILFGDPFIMLYNDMYYAYGTASSDGIAVYTSTDLITWQAAPQRRLALDKKDVWGNRWFWAPEVYHVNGKFYMYYSGDEHICVATSNSPLGPFTQEIQKPMIESEKCIDNSLFIDDDGKPYLFFDRFNDGLNIWVAELEDNLTDLKMETMQKCINVSQVWEEVWPRVNEGCFVIKRNGVYYMTYSANSYESPFYGIGVATATNIKGPWTKYDKNPIYQKVGDLVGIGHSAMFSDRDGQLRIVFHSHQSQTAIHPRVMHISTVNFKQENGKEIMTVDPDFFTPVLENKPTYNNNIGLVPNCADPYVLEYNGTYYLYGTGGRNGIKAYTSTDLAVWSEAAGVRDGFALDSSDVWGSYGFWAPEVYRINDRFYMYFTVQERIAVAESNSPLGPFVQRDKKPFHLDIPEIDTHLFTDDDGKRYLYFVRFTKGNEIWVAEINDDLQSIREETLKHCIGSSQPWEDSSREPYPHAKVNEGPFILKHKGLYYLTYSANHTANPDYGVGYATSSHPMGPWTKYEGNPILKGNGTTINGPGHHSFATSPSGQLYMIYHTHFDMSRMGPRKLAIDPCEFVPSPAGGADILKVYGPSDKPQTVK